MRGSISVTVTRDDDGTYLTANLTHNGKTYTEEVALDPIIDRLQDMIANYHAALHGDRVAGLGDYYHQAVGIAKRVAASKAARMVVDQVNAHKRDLVKQAAGFIPGGKAMADIVYKVHDIVSKAKEGDRVAKAKLETLVDMANEGDNQAKAAVRLAAIVARRIREQEDDTEVSGRNHRRSASRRRTTIPRRAPLMLAPPPAYDDGCCDEQEDQYDDQSAGWTYNRPYRGIPEVLVNLEKSPGVGMGLRELYNRGVGNPFTTKGLIISRAFGG